MEEIELLEGRVIVTTGDITKKEVEGVVRISSRFSIEILDM
ncbi:MAG: hypothetical protein ACXAEU_06730 [Candidatus Hodarchaeales archaeon]|jgi:hypothetical protein